MTKRPLVSIVLPTFNGSRYLATAIQSCYEQTYTNWELVIVDDASTDNTPLLIAQWMNRDNRIRSARHCVNRKLPAALNTGFSLATGDYVTWTSDDNLYRPHALDNMVLYLESHADVDVVYTDYSVIDTEGNLARQVQVSPPQSLVLLGNCIGASFLYRRTVQDIVGNYAEDLFLAEDYDFWLRAFAQVRIEPLHIDCYLYRIHTSSLTNQQASQVLIQDAQALMRNLPKLQNLNDQVIALAYFRLALRLAEAGLASEALVPLGHAIKCHILSSYHAQASQEMIYGPTGLRSPQALDQLLALIPDQGPTAKAFKRQVWGDYHSVKCFEGYQKRERTTVRRHFPKVIWNNANQLRNRGLLRIACWAFSRGEA